MRERTIYTKDLTVSNYIIRCLKSVLEQAYKDIEVIIVDDGSTDGSLKKIKKFTKELSNFYVYSQKNSGPALARNLGLKFVKGEYIIFIDGDDYLRKDFIESMMNYRSYDLVLTGYEEVGEKNVIKKYIPRKEYINSKNFEKHLFNDDYFSYFVIVWNKLFKTSVIKKNNLLFKNLPLAEDAIFVFDYLKCINNIKIIEKADYCNVIIPNTLSRKKIADIWEIMLIVEKAGQKDFNYEYDQNWTFFMLKLIKISLSNRIYSVTKFKSMVNKINKTKQFDKLKLKKIKKFSDKLIFLFIKLKASLILFILFKYKANKKL